MSGFGKAKAEKYGDEILKTVQDYCSRNNLESNIMLKQENPKRERKEKLLEEKYQNVTLSIYLKKENQLLKLLKKEISQPLLLKGI